MKTIEDLNKEVVELYNEGKFNEAILVAEQALILAKSLHSGDHADVASSLNNLASLYRTQGLYREAEPLYQQALEMKQRLFPGDHAAVATSLNNLGLLYQFQGRYSEAEPLYNKALKMWQWMFKGDHPDVATSLNNLAGLYESQGDYSEAEPLYKKALEMWQRLFKGDHPDVATSLNNLAELYRSQGRYRDAEPLYKQALEMWQRFFKGDHPHVAISLNNLALLYDSQGRYRDAEPLYKQALEMTKRLFTGDNPDVAISLNNLAELYRSQGRYRDAEPLYKQALEMWQRLFSDDHPDLAKSLNNLASLYRSQGRYRDAEPLYRQALEMWQRLFKGDHPDVATSLNNLAELYDFQGLYPEAEPLYEQALEIYQRLFTGAHPDVLLSLNNLGLLLAAMHRPKAAFEKMHEAIEMDDRLIRLNFAFSSEQERLKSIKNSRVNFDAFLSLVSQYFSNSPEQVQKALDVVLKRKSMTAAALAAFNFAIHSQRYSHLKPEFNRLRSLQEQLYHRINNPPLPDIEKPIEVYHTRLGEYQKDIAELEQQSQQLEKELATQVPEIQLEHQTVDRRAVALELPANAVLVEYVRFDRYDFTAPEGKNWKSAEYWAFILLAEDSDAVQMISLGEAQPIDELIEKVRQVLELKTPSKQGKGNKKGTLFKKYQYNPEYPNALREKIFTPLLSILQPYQNIFIAPDFQLSLIPFGVLPVDETGQQLLRDNYQISYLSSGKDVLRWKLETDRTASESLIIANPNFDYPDPPSEETSETQDSHDNYFKPLRETEPLAKSIAKKLAIPNLYLGDEAVETLLSQTASPRILLIATHGYFEPESPSLNLTENPLDRFAVAPANNAMIRAGLAFAGANTSRQGKTLPEDAKKMGKGLLLAQDVAGIDLWENEVTILIACQTGLGDVQLGEGVFGLRRAFAVAGCKALIMSLWEVPTRVSLLLMDRFLSDVEQGLGKREALLKAQSYIRTITIQELRQFPLGCDIVDEFIDDKKVISEEFIEANPDYQLLSHPYFWGAWISQGEM
ncbi:MULTISPECIES: CHAT domain-containing protein [unclassified Microcoleus]|uniref:CHAT domain-containing protein n=2 Tax=Microcoleus TaxID=44471 RepID=UPI001D31AF57|nr:MULTISPECIES: CHAT domain-containing tetratricopeptide repeat protein [unclassified Microcoleus]TAE08586.1 MAG: CHAT domain-containing protein [Oscillatoriales cyanobacterium]MCC3587476.1 CHAT domain-containing protein [Microcoleus sp. PH2017_30_WIL_O_A]MCC3593699.1 CHAT domain-containing protein [Microcoleus sp. PH2017_28_MFU_U_A]TAE19940.1 MAG: CHAT domain-containing protein [Oscillatoriales cyanobacterium]TAE65582.1 MAG: CHAT domain-containing protein [Oscillatoriales cyanobacterium]